MAKYDFCGWATRNDLRCSDGRTIRQNAFKDNDGQVVPLVWQHMHNNPENVLGHALLENRNEGVYAYCSFNDTEAGEIAKNLVKHGDITALSIYANQLKQNGNKDVLHGTIREVSLVLSGANPGALIEHPVLAHSDELCEDEAVIWNNYNGIFLEHSEDTDSSTSTKEDISKSSKEETNMAKEKTVKDVFDEFTEEQKNVVYFMIGKALEDANNKTEGDGGMKHNVFEPEEENVVGDALAHSQLEAIISDGKRYGSLKESFLQHAGEYGISNINYLFPDAQTINNTPDFIKRETDWVTKVMNGTHHTPFSRIKSIHANITADEARARGYVKGKKKVEEIFPVLKRTTDPQTIYKKQKLDRDDIIDITDFDVVSWLKTEMRIMLDEEIARAILIGDGRISGTDDKIEPTHIRPIWTDDDLYTIHSAVTYNSDPQVAAKNLITAAIRARKDYKGKGEPTFFTTEAQLTEMLLIDDGIGHPLYKNVSELATRLRVKEIVTVPVMENMKDVRTDTTTSKKYQPLAIIVNLSDYNVGADKGGSVNMFDDFDIDYNQQKYLIETRCSGAMTTPYGAIALEQEVTVSGSGSSTVITPVAPTSTSSNT